MSVSVVDATRATRDAEPNALRFAWGALCPCGAGTTGKFALKVHLYDNSSKTLCVTRATTAKVAHRHGCPPLRRAPREQPAHRRPGPSRRCA